jgi:hypothetical protein
MIYRFVATVASIVSFVGAARAQDTRLSGVCYEARYEGSDGRAVIGMYPKAWRLIPDAKWPRVVVLDTVPAQLRDYFRASSWVRRGDSLLMFTEGTESGWSYVLSGRGDTLVGIVRPMSGTGHGHPLRRVTAWRVPCPT